MPRVRRLAHAEVVTAIAEYTSDNGFPPTVRELAELLELASPAPMHRYLEELRAQGRVDWQPGKTRTLRVLTARAFPLSSE